MIDITYNVTQSQYKGALGYKPVVRGRILDSLFYRSIGHAFVSPSVMKDSQRADTAVLMVIASIR